MAQAVPLPLRAYRAVLRPVDAAWLAAFRMLFGGALWVSMLRFCIYGWVERLYVTPSFRFQYYAFSWVEPLPASLLHGLFWALAGIALAVALGLAFRVASVLLALGLSYLQLLDVSNYLNHYYLAALLSWLLACSPAARMYSLDAYWARPRAGTATAATVAAGWLYLFRFQVGVVYTFAGLAKAQADWLLFAQPLRIWLGEHVDLPVLGGLLAQPWAPLLMSWAGFLFDTTITGWLLWRPSRPYAYVVLLVFHALTRVLFPIGMFPVIMSIAALVFFEPDWPRRLLARGRVVATALPANPRVLGPSRFQRVGVTLGLAYCVVQLALPLRAYVYGGNVLWHEQGMRFAWRVMVRAKGGSTEFAVRNRGTGLVAYVNPHRYLTPFQEAEMSGQPDLILQLAHHIRDDFERRGLGPVEVSAHTRVSLNGRRAVSLIDPSIDLGRVDDGLAPASWVLPAPAEVPPRTRAVP